MPSAERMQGMRRRSDVALRLNQRPASPTADERLAAAFGAEDVRLRAQAALRAVSAPPSRQRWPEDALPQPVPLALKVGWMRDADAHGWFGGTPSQLELIESQSRKIGRLERELNRKRTMVHFQRMAARGQPSPSQARGTRAPVLDAAAAAKAPTAARAHAQADGDSSPPPPPSGVHQEDRAVSPATMMPATVMPATVMPATREFAPRTPSPLPVATRAISPRPTVPTVSPVSHQEALAVAPTTPAAAPATRGFTPRTASTRPLSPRASAPSRARAHGACILGTVAVATVPSAPTPVAAALATASPRAKAPSARAAPSSSPSRGADGAAYGAAGGGEGGGCGERGRVGCTGGAGAGVSVRGNCEASQESDLTASQLIAALARERAQLHQLSAELATERRRCEAAERGLERERASSAKRLDECQEALAEERRRAAAATADLLRMRAERDQLEWLLKRSGGAGSHAGSAACDVCGHAGGRVARNHSPPRSAMPKG